MNVFVSETCYRQVFGSAKGSSAQRVDDFNRLVARLQEARTRWDLSVKGLGTKKYRSLDHDVYGVDLNNGLTAERVIFLYVDPAEVEGAACFDRYLRPGETESVLLCYCSEHDSQHRHARQVGQAAARDGVPDIALSLPDAERAELERVERLEVPWRAYAPGDLEHYGRPRTPVLTQSKFRIVNDFLARERPVLVTGAAGSGKTELGLRVLADFARSRPTAGVRALYLTFSQRLLTEVETRCPDDVRPACSFLTFETLVRTLLRDPDLRFAGASTFARFVAALRARPAMGGQDRGRMLRLLDERGPGCAYAEVYGVIGGSMGALWDRLDAGEKPAGEKPAKPQGENPASIAPSGLLARDAYLALPDERCGLSGERDRAAAYALAEAYARWVGQAGLASLNATAVDLAARTLHGAYGLVVVDEAQDLTEVQLELLHRLAGGLPRVAGDPASAAPVRLFMTGDVNQVLAPTAFDARRLMRMDARLQVERLSGNFRNPEAVCDLANALAQVRASSRRLFARRGAEGEPEESFNRSPGRTLWWVGSDEETLLAMADEGANVALVCDAATYRRLRPLSPSVFTVEQVKGMEFENVILYGVLTASEKRLDALFAEGLKDASLHRVLNKLYVGVTRSCGSLLVAEPRHTTMLGRLAGLDARFERVADLADVDFELDATARGYLGVGRTLKEQGAHAAARANLERALELAERDAGALTAREIEDARRLAAACRIYEANDPETVPEARLAALFEEAGLYEEALPHARAALDDRAAALLSLAADRRLDGARFGAADRVAAFEDACARGGFDAVELYGRSAFYDGLLDWYFEQRCEDLELFALEAEEHVAGALAALRAARGAFPQVAGGGCG